MNKMLQPDVSPAGFTEPKSWEYQKERLLNIFTTLTEADLTYEENKKEKMMEKLQGKLGKTKEELIAIFEII